ncbi:MAG TPA: M50 family metallopeptidase [Anaerolineaceae bacterium]|nr:M50 family metallopeptidase [Anaerolineaceae bacterium]
MDFLVVIFMATLCFLISIAVHEFGHILTGLKEGFKFHTLVLGPFGFKRDEKDKIIFYFEKDVSLWGGLAATVPTNDNEDNFKKFGRVLLGGPIASIIFGAVWMPFGIIEKNNFFLLLGLMPLSMGIISLIPLRNGAFYTDGGRWRRMHKNKKTQAVEVAIWNLTQNAIIHGNYKKANLNEIMILKKDEDIRTKFLGHYYAYCYYKDHQDTSNIEEEKAELERLKDKVPKQMVSIFSVD